MNIFFIRDNQVYYFILLALGVVFVLINFYTPWIADDYNYHFMYEPVRVGNAELIRSTRIPVETFADVLKSQYNHYQSVNGRVSALGTVQLFCLQGLSKSVFNVFNTIVFLLFLDNVTILCACRRSVSVLLLSFCSVMLLFPFPGQTLFWISGSINYLWTATFSILLIRLFFSDYHKCSILYLVILFICSVFVGNMNESITLGLCGGLIFYALFNRMKFFSSPPSLSENERFR